jgi:hypothetical protein
MSSLVVLCLSSYYRFVLLPHYELVSPWAFVAYVQTISSDVARASHQLVPPLISHVCHRSELVWPQIQRSMCISATLSCWTCRLLVGQYSALYNMAGRIVVI